MIRKSLKLEYFLKCGAMLSCSWGLQFRTLLHRTLLTQMRNPTDAAARVLISCYAAAIGGESLAKLLVRRPRQARSPGSHCPSLLHMCVNALVNYAAYTGEKLDWGECP